ncbi:MAG: hypothetical protein Q9223_007426 [Gallowayella weberi]
MEVHNDHHPCSTSHSNSPWSFSSAHTTPTSISSFHKKYPSTLPSNRPSSESSAHQVLSDLKSLVNDLEKFKNETPGPKLIRLQREFCDRLGHGGQGNVYGVSAEFKKTALELQDMPYDQRTKHSAIFWTKCVVKHLRTDQRRNDVRHAYREIRPLCHPRLQRHPNIVNLVSWGLSLDALETVSLNSLSTPLLILERAHCDLAQFIKSEDYEIASFDVLCDICLGVGRGLDSVHSTGMIHGDLKLENILLFPKETSTGRWVAKLCDFGAALTDSQNSRYLGTDTWLPPECYENIIVGKAMPGSLIPCDIFVYGLVIWATFIGISFSPIHNDQQIEGGAYIVRNVGRQQFYAKAVQSVTAKYSTARSNVHRLLAGLTDQTLGHFGGSGEREGLERRQSRNALDRYLYSDNLMTVEDRIRRILIVLHCCLNDSPHLRDRQPWRYLDYKRFPRVPNVDNPATFKPDYDQSSMLKHYVLQLISRKNRADQVYAFARLRSQIPLCCWQHCTLGGNHCMPFTVTFKGLTLEGALSSHMALDVVAWVCRGEIGQHEVQRWNDRQNRVHLFSTFSPVYPTTDIFLLIFENDYAIHQIVQTSDGPKTEFLRYLLELREPEEALVLAVHFQRIAAKEESSLEKKYFLTGRTSDVCSSEEFEGFASPNFSTALHDAVKVNNYPLVEYLVKTGFNVSARDAQKKLALEFAAEIEGPSSAKNSIIALLRQNSRNQGLQRGKSPESPPLGWERLHQKPGMDVWRETSIEGHFDAISFIEPKTGLHDSDRLTLGRIQGEDQIYRLDPWRFLKTRGDVVAGYEPATKATFGDEWYEENIRTVAKPLPFSPTADQRAWIRYPATSLYQLSQFYDGRTWVFMSFTFLCATARISNWQKLEFPLATIASAFYAYAISSVSLGKKDLMKNGVRETTPNSGYGSLIRSNALELFVSLPSFSLKKCAYLCYSLELQQ